MVRHEAAEALGSFPSLFLLYHFTSTPHFHSYIILLLPHSPSPQQAPLPIWMPLNFCVILWTTKRELCARAATSRWTWRITTTQTNSTTRQCRRLVYLCGIDVCMCECVCECEVVVEARVCGGAIYCRINTPLFNLRMRDFVMF